MSRRVEKLEQDARQSRERLSATLNELRTRMRPANLRQESSEYLAHTAPGRFVANLKADALGNPVPLALLGVAVAWLAATDRSADGSASSGRYAIVARWWARRLSQLAQQNASKAVSTAKATRSAAGELQQRATDASRDLADQLRRAPSKVRELGQTVAESTTTRANVVGDVTRAHPMLVGTAAAGLAASAVGFALLYRRYAGELEAASRLVRASEQEPERETIALLREAHATLVPQEVPSAMQDQPVTFGAGQ